MAIKYTHLIIVFCVYILFNSVAHADILIPSDQNIDIEASFDLANSPTKITLWSEKSGGYDTTNASRWAFNYWTCNSDSNPLNGKCSTGKGGWATSFPIILTFTEKKSGATQNISLNGMRKSQFVGGSPCGNYGDSKPMNVSAQNDCQGAAQGVAVTVDISPSELKKIPIGGIWEADLKLTLHNSNNTERYNWDAHLVLKITDINHQQIYLPKFGQAEPLIDLNLRPLPGTSGQHSIFHGKSTLDMCLYDGYNSESSQFTIQIKGAGSPARPENVFYVYRDGGSYSKDEDRVDFFVKMFNPVTGQFIEVNRGQEMVIPDIQKARIRQVHLPDIPQLCSVSLLR